MKVELDGQKVLVARWMKIGSQEEMAQRAGIAVGTLRRVEHNRGAVTLRTARNIARVLDVEPKSLGRAHLRRVK